MNMQREAIWLAHAVFNNMLDALLTRNGDPLAAVRFTYRKLEDVTERLLQQTPPKDLPDCSKGCSYCCHQGVACTPPEAYLWALAMAPHWKRVQEFCDITMSLDETDICTRKVPCPALLHPEGKPSHERACAVYDVRPIACRSVATSGAGICKRAFGQPDATMPFVAAVRGPAGIAGFAMICAMHAAGRPAPVVKLRECALAMLQDPALYTQWSMGNRYEDMQRYASPYAPLTAPMAVFAKAARKSVKRLIETQEEWSSPAIASFLVSA